MVPGSETTATKKSPQCGEEPSRIDDVVPEPQVETLEKSNRGEKTRVMAVQ